MLSGEAETTGKRLWGVAMIAFCSVPRSHEASTVETIGRGTMTSRATAR